MRLPTFAIMGGLFALSLLAGCGDSFPMSEVAGKLTIDGQPFDGAIQFSPVDGNAPTAGGLIKAGQFLVKVPPGEMKVSVSAAKVVGKKKIYDTADSPEMPITEEALPARYNEKTELKFLVQPGSNTMNLELKSK